MNFYEAIQDMWRTHQTVGVGALAFAIPFLYYKFLGPWLTLLWAHILAYSAFTAFAPFDARPVYEGFAHGKFPQSAAQTAMILLILPLIVLYKKDWGPVVAKIIVLNMIPMFVYGYGVFNVYSMDTTAIAVASVYLLTKGEKQWALIGAIASFYKFGETALASLFVGLYFYYFQRIKSITLKLLGALALVSTSVYILYFPPGSLQTRLHGWNTIMSWWFEKANRGLGTGPGSYEWIGPFFELGNGGTLLWFHNDYLQFLFDYGYLGVFLAFGAIIWITRRAIATQYLGVWFAMLISMTTYFPLRFFLTQFLFLYTTREIIDVYRNQKLVQKEDQIHA